MSLSSYVVLYIHVLDGSLLYFTLLLTRVVLNLLNEVQQLGISFYHSSHIFPFYRFLLLIARPLCTHLSSALHVHLYTHLPYTLHLILLINFSPKPLALHCLFTITITHSIEHVCSFSCIHSNFKFLLPCYIAVNFYSSEWFSGLFR